MIKNTKYVSVPILACIGNSLREIEEGSSFITAEGDPFIEDLSGRFSLTYSKNGEPNLLVSTDGIRETLRILRGRGIITPKNYSEGTYGFDTSLDGLAGRLGY